MFGAASAARSLLISCVGQGQGLLLLAVCWGFWVVLCRITVLALASSGSSRRRPAAPVASCGSDQAVDRSFISSWSGNGKVEVDADAAGRAPAPRAYACVCWCLFTLSQWVWQAAAASAAPTMGPSLPLHPAGCSLASPGWPSQTPPVFGALPVAMRDLDLWEGLNGRSAEPRVSSTAPRCPVQSGWF